MVNAFCTIKTAASVPFLYERTMGDWIFQVKSRKDWGLSSVVVIYKRVLYLKLHSFFPRAKHRFSVMYINGEGERSKLD